MSIMLLYSCTQVEMTVRDIPAARNFMIDVLDASKVEQQLASEIRALFPDGGYDLEHLDCGGAVFQFNEPSPALEFNGHKIVHQQYLDRIGPCITNLNFYVDDAEHANDVLASNGAAVQIEGPSNTAPSLADYGPENSRSGAEQRKFRFMGSRHLFGFDLEFMEPNFNRFSEQRAQIPNFIHPRPTSGSNLQFQRLRIVVESLAQTYANIQNILLPACHSKPYHVHKGSLAQSFRISFGGMELEYCEPLKNEGELADQLSREGPGVVAVVFAAEDFNKIVTAAENANCRVEYEPDFLGIKEPHAEIRPGIKSREIIGFDVVLENVRPELYPAAK